MSFKRTSMHMSMDVRSMLHWPKRKLKGALIDGNGFRLTSEQVFDALLDALGNGIEVLPFGKPCEGWSDKTGCPGHDAEVAE